jgi:hypothetical protein
MLQPDRHMDDTLQIALESMREIVSEKREVELYTARTLEALRLLVQQFATSSQVTSTQQGQLGVITFFRTIFGSPSLYVIICARKQTQKNGDEVRSFVSNTVISDMLELSRNVRESRFLTGKNVGIHS